LTSVDLITFGLLALKVSFVLMMMVYLISGLDDLFMDLLFFAMKAKQWFAGNSGRHRPSLEEMVEKREQPFALMFPALVGAPRPRFSTSKGGSGAEGAEGRGEPGASINITGWQTACARKASTSSSAPTLFSDAGGPSVYSRRS
jgi:hypothetical protein